MFAGALCPYCRPGDPVTQEQENVLKYPLPAAPPGVHRPRAVGSQDKAVPTYGDELPGPAGAPAALAQITLLHSVLLAHASNIVLQQQLALSSP
jgi:hypothetical protein